MVNQIQNWSDILNVCLAICDEHMHFLRPKGCHIHGARVRDCSVQYIDKWLVAVQPIKVTVVSIHCQLGARTQTLVSYHPLHLHGLFECD